MRAGVLLRVLAALAVVFSLLAGWHWLLIDRLIEQPQWPDFWATWLRRAVILGGVAIPFGLLGQRFTHPKNIRVWLTWPASLWMGLAFMLLMGVLITDLVSLTIPVAKAFNEPMSTELGLPNYARSRALLVVGVAGAATLWGLRRAFFPKIQRVDVSIAGWPSALDGFRIVQLTDIHIGPILGSRFLKRIVAQANAEDPDIIALTGDLVDGRVEHVGDQIGALADLRATHGRFFVTGNHDYYSDADPWCARIEALGMEPLRNEHRVIQHEGAAFTLAGVDDHRGDSIRGRSGEDIPAALDGRVESRPVVLLAHDPATFRAASRQGVDLQISGHTHGGQIWPFRYVVRATVKWVAGLYKEGRSQIYVSRGTGFWGPPIRVAAPSEISVLTIRRA